MCFGFVDVMGIDHDGVGAVGVGGVVGVGFVSAIVVIGADVEVSGFILAKFAGS